MTFLKLLFRHVPNLLTTYTRQVFDLYITYYSQKVKVERAYIISLLMF